MPNPPSEKSDSGSWFYFDGKQWLKYSSGEPADDVPPPNPEMILDQKPEAAKPQAETWTYGYDSRNRMTTVTCNTRAISEQYSYDDTGQRIKKDNGETIAYYFFKNYEQTTEKEAAITITDKVYITETANSNGSITMEKTCAAPGWN